VPLRWALRKAAWRAGRRWRGSPAGRPAAAAGAARRRARPPGTGRLAAGALRVEAAVASARAAVLLRLGPPEPVLAALGVTLDPAMALRPRGRAAPSPRPGAAARAVAQLTPGSPQGPLRLNQAVAARQLLARRGIDAAVFLGATDNCDLTARAEVRVATAP
jgi:hypothetical protein